MPVTLAELAQQFDCDLQGDGSTVVDRVATLVGAGANAVSFLANPLYRTALTSTQAGAVILSPEAVSDCPTNCLVTANPYATYARVASFLHPPPKLEPGIASSAVIASDAEIAATAEIGPLASIGSGARIGDSVRIGAGCVVGSDVAIDAETRLAPRVTILDRVRIGRRCLLHSGVVVGADGFGFAQSDQGWVKVPQLGTVVIGDDVEVGANTTIDRGTIEDTVLEDGVKLDNLVQIAHNVRVGEHTVMAAMSGAAGSTKIGRRCMIGGGVVMVGHLSICDDVMFLFRSVVTRSIDAPGTYGGSLPAEEASKWRRSAARFRRLDALEARMRSMERSLKRGSEGAD
jgi:UDP-3-O-[3-hydroxymyristoyl] glucosamine N-acyltransferase